MNWSIHDAYHMLYPQSKESFEPYHISHDTCWSDTGEMGQYRPTDTSLSYLNTLSPNDMNYMGGLLKMQNFLHSGSRIFCQNKSIVRFQPI